MKVKGFTTEDTLRLRSGQAPEHEGNRRLSFAFSVLVDDLLPGRIQSRR